MRYENYKYKEEMTMATRKSVRVIFGISALGLITVLPAQAQELPVITKEEGAIVQVTGPSGTTFVDPAQDPQKK